MKKLKKKLKLGFNLLQYDIETAHLKGRFWRLGDQVIRHKQLLKNADKTQILTISYKWYNENKVTVLDCGKAGEKTQEMIQLFDKEIKRATVVIGKNNHRFDNTHINTARLLTGGTGMPEWFYKSDDVESQLRKYFNFPSFSLDYVSEALGHGGKMKMEEEDWNNIEDFIEFNKLCYNKILSTIYSKYHFCKFFYGKSHLQIIKDGNKAFNKMKKYNKIDVIRTEAVLTSILPHVMLKYNASVGRVASNNQYPPVACITCGSRDIISTTNITRGSQRRIQFYCNNHKGYAGSRPFIYTLHKNRKFTGAMGK